MRYSNLFIHVILLNVFWIFPSESKSCDGVGQPLYLTPFIKNGSIEEARKLTLVELAEMPNTTSYAGLFTVNETYNSNTFFWFFPARINPETAPVLVSFQGGPGGTSMMTLLVDHGPFKVTPNITLERREFSWTESISVIYVDNPVGVGYSFTENVAGYATEETQIGRDLLSFTTQFFELFPEYSKNDFIVAGESYAAKFVLSLGRAIDGRNNVCGHESKINLKGLVLEGCIVDPINQMDYGDYFYQIGLIDYKTKSMFAGLEEQIRQLIRDEKYREAFYAWDAMVFIVQGPSLFRNLTGIESVMNYLRPKILPNGDWMEPWMQREDVRCAIHVGNNRFVAGNLTVNDKMRDDFMQSMAPVFVDLVERYRILVIEGQTDIIVPYPTVENFIYRAKWSGSTQWANATRKPWFVDGELAGYAKNFANLTEILIRSSGHKLAFDQPKWTFNAITKWAKNEPLDVS